MTEKHMDKASKIGPKLIVGLGNIGEKYAQTRHNIGFAVLDRIASDAKSKYKNVKKTFAETAILAKENEKIYLAKPTTFMNDSGKSVKALLDYYQIPYSSLIVIHDEIDLPLGAIRISSDSGSAGHKGVDSIIQVLGTKKIHRIRIGIETREEDEKTPTEKFVLQKFNKKELKKIEETVIPEAIKLTLDLTKTLC